MGNAVVYRPAYDAEVEYLESTGTQWIDTGIVPTSDTSFEIEFQQVAFTYKYAPVAHCGEYYNSNDTFGFCIFNFISTNINGIASYYGTFSNIYVGNNFVNIGDRLNVKYRRCDTNIVLTNKSSGITDSNSLDTTFTNGSRTLYILYGNTKTDDLRHPSAMKLYFCKIYNGSTLIRDFVPVRIGTTGYMYDKVSRQLFANAGTGQFVLGNDVANATVPQLRHVVYFGGQRCVGFEKVYEKCAWLKGDGYAFIDTNILFESSDNILTRINITELPTNSSYFFIYGNDSSDYDYTLMAVLFSNSNVEFRPQRAPAYLPKSSYDIIHNLDGVSINGTKVIDLHKDYVYVNKSICIFTSHYLGGARINFPGDIAYFRITDPTFTIDRINMFPCRLLVDIPTILDGNGIARQAGECGMWDTVSGRFFGNVADRGTFDVVYFKEGVDYEVHQWLKGDGTAYIDTLRLANEGLDFDTRVKDLSFKKAFLWNRSENVETPAIAVYHSGVNNGIVRFQNNYTSYVELQNQINYDYVVSSNGGYMTVNGTVYSFQKATSDLSDKSIKLFNIDIGYIPNDSNTIDVKCAYFTLRDGNMEVMHLVPCRLLRPIPAELDANCIARSAGECGMYDTVNDKFYGNVASSGTFSVSDDE